MVRFLGAFTQDFWVVDIFFNVIFTIQNVVEDELSGIGDYHCSSTILQILCSSIVL